MEEARIVVDVQVGLLPGTPMNEYSKRFAITSEEWHGTEDKATLLSEFNGKVQGYAIYWMMQPDRVNWVRTDWIYM